MRQGPPANAPGRWYSYAQCQATRVQWKDASCPEAAAAQGGSQTNAVRLGELYLEVPDHALYYSHFCACCLQTAGARGEQGQHRTKERPGHNRGWEGLAGVRHPGRSWQATFVLNDHHRTTKPERNCSEEGIRD